MDSAGHAHPCGHSELLHFGIRAHAEDSQHVRGTVGVLYFHVFSGPRAAVHESTSVRPCFQCIMRGLFWEDEARAAGYTILGSTVLTLVKRN